MFITPVLGPLTIPRGWLSVDGKIRGKQFRFVTSHLESFHAGVQAVQASELIVLTAKTPRPPRKTKNVEALISFLFFLGGLGILAVRTFSD